MFPFNVLDILEMDMMQLCVNLNQQNATSVTKRDTLQEHAEVNHET